MRQGSKSIKLRQVSSGSINGMCLFAFSIVPKNSNFKSKIAVKERHEMLLGATDMHKRA